MAKKDKLSDFSLPQKSVIEMDRIFPLATQLIITYELEIQWFISALPGIKPS